MLIPRHLRSKFTSRALEVIDHLESVGNFTLIELLAGIYEAEGSLGSNFLKSQELTRANLTKLELVTRRLPVKVGLSSLNAALKKAMALASTQHHFFVGTQHLLYGIFTEFKDRPEIATVIGTNFKAPEKLERSLRLIIDSGSNFPNLEDVDVVYGMAERPMNDQLEDNYLDAMLPKLNKELADSKALKKPVGRTNLPPQFGEDLTAKARRGGIDPLIGRTKEVDRLIQILCRRTKSNPLLIGEAGVGKTAIVQGLAQRIVEGKVPTSLLNKRVYDLKLSLLVAGTMFRGEFEARLEGIIQEAKRNEVILFIDEIHNIVGAGSAQGSLDAANILKPPLAQGEIQVIGATTLEEFRRYIERDKALERRFQPILVQEPSLEETRQILFGIKSVYEKFHNVVITDEAINSAVELGSRYIVDRFLPDKAIDLLDEAAARVKSEKLQMKEVVELKGLTDALAECARRKEREIEKAAYDQAFEIKNQEKLIHTQIAALEKTMLSQEEKVAGQISWREIERVVAEKTGIPVERLNRSEGRRLKNLGLELGRRIVGQTEAISSLAMAIKRARAGLSRPNRPLGSFLFLGPTGVGKTALSRALAEVVFGPEAFLKLDMSEFMEPHSVSKLLGAPAGYIGYGESAQLAQAIRHRPYSLVLFDEIEKAHPQVLNVFLQILEDGRVTDAMGREINFKNSIVIMTSNIGTARFTERAALGFGASQNTSDEDAQLVKDFDSIEQDALKELKETLRPELLNRLDKVIVFKALDKRAIRQIAQNQIAEFKERLLTQARFEISLPKATTDFIVETSFKPMQGARLVNRVIENVIENTIASAVINGELTEGAKATIIIKKGEPQIKIKARVFA